MNEFATMEAVINYKEKALPNLKMKLQQQSYDEDDKYVKCSISDILSNIGGNEAELILIEAKKKETDPEIVACMRKGMDGFRNHR